MDFCYLYEYTSEKREGEEESRRDYSPIARSPHCLKCGHGIEVRKIDGGVWYFDERTETIHVCRPSPGAMRRKLNREWEIECEKQEAARTTLKVGGKNVEL